MEPGLPRVLFLSPDLEDYLADGLLHGLRELLGERLVDYPKHEVMYRSCPEGTLRSIRGRGFTLYGRLDDIPVSRARVIEQARWGQFDVVVFSAIHSTFGRWVDLYADLGDTPLAVLDGSDEVALYPYRGKWWRRRQHWFLPRAHTRATYFKRELTPETYAYRCFRLLPAAVASRLPILRRVRPLAFSIPEEAIVGAPPEKHKDFAAHVVDEEAADRIPGASTSYAFATEAEYVADLRASRFGVTAKRGGWDCLRHYELAANGCVPCFRELRAKPASCAPHGLSEANCVVYSSADDLLRQVEAMTAEEYERLQAASIAWACENTTRRRAAGFLRELGFDVPDRATAPAPSVVHA
jgi:hypothetical protein